MLRARAAISLAKEYADALPAGVTADQIYSSEAFSNSAGVAVLDKTYRSIQGAFVPFHTHLGHPGQLPRPGRAAPTSADIWAHRALMIKTAANSSDASVPGPHPPRRRRGDRSSGPARPTTCRCPIR